MSEKQNYTPIAATPEEVVAAIRRKTALSLPDDPSAAGISAATIRRRFWEAICGADASVLAEMTRIINEANVSLNSIDQRTLDAIEQARQAALSAENKAASVVEDAKKAAIEAAEEAILDEIEDTKKAAALAVSEANTAATTAQAAASAVEEAVAEAVGDAEEKLEQAVADAVAVAQAAERNAKQAAEEAKRAAENAGGANIFANALKGSATGAAVRMDDVSPVTHEIKVKLTSKNVIPYPYVRTSPATTNGITFTPNEDRSITISGVATGNAYYVLWNADLGSKHMVGDSSGGTNGNYAFSPFVNYSSANKNVSVYVPNGTDLTTPVTIYPQIVKGTELGKYTPYIEDFSAVKVKRYGKNLFDISKVKDYKPDGVGYSLVNNRDGSITVTLTSDTSIRAGAPYTLRDYAPDLKVGETYTLSADTTGTNKYIYLTEFKSSWYFGKSRVVTEEMLNSRVNWYASGENTIATISNIQIEPGKTASKYEPFVEPTEYTPNADGTVEGVTSLSPTTTLMTDTEGAVIDVEYNRDINQAFDELKQAIISLGGNV